MLYPNFQSVDIIREMSNIVKSEWMVDPSNPHLMVRRKSKVRYNLTNFITYTNPSLSCTNAHKYKWRTQTNQTSGFRKGDGVLIVLLYFSF